MMITQHNNITSNITIKNENLTRNINFSLLFIHIILFITFIIVDAPIMIIMNIASIAVYTYLFYIIDKNLVVYLLVVYVEILIHMTLASLCFGWNCGFQLYFFAFIPIIYYCDYISKKRNIMKIHTLPMSVIVIATSLILRMFAYGDYTIYTHISETTSIVMYNINIIITFFFIMLFMSMFEKMSLKNENMLQHLAEYDILTNLSNRHRMTNIFSELTQKNCEFCVAILDIDNFKKVNDSYGHNVGDNALIAFADILRKAESDNVYVGRWGGEEFLVVTAGDSTYTHSKDLLEQIRVDISKVGIPTDNGEIFITVSGGISKFLKGEPVSKTIQRADSYLYIAKNNGKNQIIANDNEELF